MRTSGDPVTLDGAVLRVNPDTGAGLPTNPFAFSSDANARRIVAHGLRNPFRFTFRPGTSEIWTGDVGWGDWEEINRVVNASDTVVENLAGRATRARRARRRTTPPTWRSARTSTARRARSRAVLRVSPQREGRQRRVVPDRQLVRVTGQAFEFYTGGPYPSEYDGALFFSDYSRDCIWAMRQGANGLPAPGLIRTFAAAAANPVDVQMSPAGEPFYDLDGGTVRRIQYGQSPQEPPGEEKAAGRPASASTTYSSARAPSLSVDRDPSTRWARCTSTTSGGRSISGARAPSTPSASTGRSRTPPATRS